MKPFLTWVGSKRQLLKTIEENWPQEFNTYYEPFLGSGCVFLHFSPKKAILNDSNKSLMKTYRCVANELPALLESLKRYEGRNTKKQFNEARAIFNFIRLNEIQSTVEEAALFIYLNRNSYGGMYRENNQGGYNGTFAKQIVHWPSADLYKEIHKVLASPNVHLSCESYEQSLKDAKEGDFVFVDPPYHKTFDKYSSNGFSEKDHVELAALLTTLDKKGVKFMAFNTNTELIQELYKKFEIIRVSKRSKLTRKESNEILIKNY